MTLIEKIEKGLTLCVSDNDGNLFLFENAFNALFSTDPDCKVVLEKVTKLCDLFNTSENKEVIVEMEVSDLLKMI